MRPNEHKSCPGSGRLRRVVAAGLVVGLASAKARAEDGAAALADELRELRRQVEELRQEVRILKRQHEVDVEQAEVRAAGQPRVRVGDPNVEFRSPDSKYSLKIRGFVQADSRWYLDPRNVTNNNAAPRGDTFLIRRARLVAEGRFLQDFTYFFQPEFAGAAASLLDASVNYAPIPELQFKAGRFKTPLGLEYLETPTYMMGMDWSVVTGFLPLRDNGFTVHGDIADALFSYEAGIMNGGPDGANAAATDIDGTKEGVVRLFTHPFATGPSWIRGLGFGAGASWGRHEGVGGRMAALQSGGFAPVFAIRTDGASPAEPDGDQWRLVPQVYYYNGPLAVMGEYIVDSAAYRGGLGRTAADHTRMDNAAWHADVGYVLTGEDATYRGVTPRHNFSLTGDGWGAVQLFARYSGVQIDGRAFPVLANPALSIRSYSGFVGGVNWYLNPNVRVNLHYAMTQFDGGGGAGLDRPTEHAILTRVQVAF